MASEEPIAGPPSRLRYTVGYALPPKKQESFIQVSLLSAASSGGIDLLAIDPLLPLSSQGPFDAVIHKLASSEWVAQLDGFAHDNPFVPIIDPPHAVDRLHNRISMLQIVSDIRLPPRIVETLGIPKQIVFYDSSSLSVEDLRFPLVAKPLVADDSATSHEMFLVFHREDLSRLKPPIVLQEFINHGGVVFKVYVVGDYTQCVKRRSLPNILEDGHDPVVGPIPFSQVSNHIFHERVESSDGLLDNIKEAEMPPIEFLEEVARQLKKAMGLRLFNFDVIRDSNNGSHYFIIDINYFPGYAKMPSYETVFTDFLLNVIQESKKVGDGGDEENKGMI